MRRRSLSFGVLLLLLGLFPLASYAEALESGLRDVVGKLVLHALEQAAARFPFWKARPAIGFPDWLPARPF